MLKRMVRTATISMTTRERRIVNFRFGVLGKELSFEEIGQKMGLSAQDVEITFVAAMSKARRFVDETASWLKAELKRPASTTHTSGLAH
jgi:DNA-directed RNA polymerase sigma subunit (sigma70/sigma32)